MFVLEKIGKTGLARNFVKKNKKNPLEKKIELALPGGACRVALAGSVFNPKKKRKKCWGGACRLALAGSVFNPITRPHRSLI